MSHMRHGIHLSRPLHQTVMRTTEDHSSGHSATIVARRRCRLREVSMHELSAPISMSSLFAALQGTHRLCNDAHILPRWPVPLCTHQTPAVPAFDPSAVCGETSLPSRWMLTLWWLS